MNSALLALALIATAPRAFAFGSRPQTETPQERSDRTGSFQHLFRSTNKAIEMNPSDPGCDLDRNEHTVRSSSRRKGLFGWVPGVGSENFTTRMTSYYPKNSHTEGGLCDQLGYPLNTIEDFIRGHHRPEFLAAANHQCDHPRPPGYKVDYVSVAGDIPKWISRHNHWDAPGGFRLGQTIDIPEISSALKNRLRGRKIVFRVVDTGSAFTGARKTHIDVCRDPPEKRLVYSSYENVPADVQHYLDKNLHFNAAVSGSYI